MTTFKTKIERLQEEIGHLIPLEYKEFLRQHTEGTPHKPIFSYTTPSGREGHSCIAFFFSIDSSDAQHDVLSNYRYYLENDRIQSGILPIAMDIADNLVCLDVRKLGGKIVYWNHEEEFNKNKGISKLADSLSAFLSTLSLEENNG